MKEKEEKTEDSKLKSRKFAVWLVWLIIAVLTLIILGISIIITKQTDESLVSLFSSALNDFFIISAIYLGVNVVQKGAFAIADVLAKKQEEQEGEK